jgi:hypothetical protein
MARKKSNDDSLSDIYILVGLLREKIEDEKELFPIDERELIFCLWWMLKQVETRHPFW